MTYPLAPLAEAMGLSEDKAYKALGINRKTKTVRRIRGEGMTADEADRFAVKAGFMPWEIWPDWTVELTGVGMVPCGSCGELFDAYRPGHRYCSTTCRRREQQRRYRTSPRVAEANRANRRAYYAACGAYERAREHRKYWADPEKARQRKRARGDAA